MEQTTQNDRTGGRWRPRCRQSCGAPMLCEYPRLIEPVARTHLLRLGVLASYAANT